MRPKSIALKTKVINFHIDSEQKSRLKAFAKKEEKGFSQLVRTAIAEYIEKLQEKAEIQELREGRECKEFFSKYDKAIEGFSETKDFSLLDEFISYTWKKYKKKAIGLAKNIPDVEKSLHDLKLNVAYQYLVFTVRLMAWDRQLIASLPYVLGPEFEAKEKAKKSQEKSDSSHTKKESPMLQGEIRVTPEGENWDKREDTKGSDETAMKEK